jgi:hypothetical protein
MPARRHHLGESTPVGAAGDGSNDPDLLDDGVRTRWRKPLGDARQWQECESTRRSLESQEFDRMAGEETIAHVLSGR